MDFIGIKFCIKYIEPMYYMLQYIILYIGNVIKFEQFKSAGHRLQLKNCD